MIFLQDWQCKAGELRYVALTEVETHWLVLRQLAQLYFRCSCRFLEFYRHLGAHSRDLLAGFWRGSAAIDSLAGLQWGDQWQSCLFHKRTESYRKPLALVSSLQSVLFSLTYLSLLFKLPNPFSDQALRHGRETASFSAWQPRTLEPRETVRTKPRRSTLPRLPTLQTRLRPEQVLLNHHPRT